MTTTLEKTEVKTTWNLEQVQEMTAKITAENFMDTMAVISKLGEEKIHEYYTLHRAHMVKYLKEHKVSTPLELVKAKAEFETNVFGSKIEFWGDEKEAHMTYLTCGVWNAMEKMGLPKERMEKLTASFGSCVAELGKEFGFEGEVKMGESCSGSCTPTLTFRK